MRILRCIHYNEEKYEGKVIMVSCEHPDILGDEGMWNDDWKCPFVGCDDIECDLRAKTGGVGSIQ